MFGNVRGCSGNVRRCPGDVRRCPGDVRGLSGRCPGDVRQMSGGCRELSGRSQSLYPESLPRPRCARRPRSENMLQTLSGMSGNVREMSGSVRDVQEIDMLDMSYVREMSGGSAQKLTRAPPSPCRTRSQRSFLQRTLFKGAEPSSREPPSREADFKEPFSREPPSRQPPLKKPSSTKPPARASSTDPLFLQKVFLKRNLQHKLLQSKSTMFTCCAVLRGGKT